LAESPDALGWGSKIPLSGKDVIQNNPIIYLKTTENEDTLGVFTICWEHCCIKKQIASGAY
jgi:hypothetical protein